MFARTYSDQWKHSVPHLGVDERSSGASFPVRILSEFSSDRSRSQRTTAYSSRTPYKEKAQFPGPHRVHWCKILEVFADSAYQLATRLVTQLWRPGHALPGFGIRRPPVFSPPAATKVIGARC